MQTEPTVAEKLLCRISAEGGARVAVLENAELAYEANDVPAQEQRR